MSAINVLVTGANGFVGSALVARLAADERYAPVAAVRDPGPWQGPCPAVRLELGEPGALPDMAGVSVVIHTAARVHVMHDVSQDPLSAFRAINVEGTLALARAAAASGAKRFIYLSSIKVNGEGTALGRPFTAGDAAAPQDPYGVSKHEAEQALFALAAETGLQVVIIRPPLVYGPGVRANFLSMMRWLDRGVPLPLGIVHNRRSLVGLDNLVDLTRACISHPAAAGQVFLASDGEDLSTTQLLQRLSQALGRRARLLSVPSVVLSVAAALLGKRAIAQRICGSLQVDIEKNRTLLGWTPTATVDTQLRKTADHYRDTEKK